MTLIGRIAKILEDGTLVLNKGEDGGVAPGQRFVIYALGDEIHDPESGDSLGRIELVKGHAQTIHVQAKLSLLRLERPEGRHKTLSEMMATLSGTGDDAPGPEAAAGDWARAES